MIHLSVDTERVVLELDVSLQRCFDFSPSTNACFFIRKVAHVIGGSLSKECREQPACTAIHTFVEGDKSVGEFFVTFLFGLFSVSAGCSHVAPFAVCCFVVLLVFLCDALRLCLRYIVCGVYLSIFKW